MSQRYERPCGACKSLKLPGGHPRCRICWPNPNKPNWEPCTTDQDTINHPPHYTWRGGIEPIDFITSNNLDWLEGNIVKYVHRYPFKGGVEDLKKARFYLDKLIGIKEGKA